METCTYELSHSAIAATHFYKAYEGDRVNLCFECASRFGYPEYLIEYPQPWRPQYGYLVATLNGTGEFGEVETWPMDGSAVEWWLDVLGCPDVHNLLADASWEPYRAHQVIDGAWTYEAARVTCLPLAQVCK